LSNSFAIGTSIDVTENAPPIIFCEQRKSALRNRAGQRAIQNAGQSAAHDQFLLHYIAEELHARLSMVSRDFAHVLIIGPIAAFADTIMHGRKAIVECAALSEAECSNGAILFSGDGHMPIAPDSYDLIITAATLDSANDVPGALIQMRRGLRPDGLFLGTLFGAGTLAALKSAMLAASDDQAQPHIHPQIEIRQAADLMQRTGFALPVADLDCVETYYSDWRRLVDDLRNIGVGNALAGPRRYLGRNFPAQLDRAWAQMADGSGRVLESFNLLHLSGWAPAPHQPKPAPRGSGTVSLASALKAK
jgi:NADH dehydrogenase [ubiquinone] 1 alpha subcomplex assembly factor 5